jgi:hypothetical protein
MSETIGEDDQCRRLQQNDPTLTDVRICSHNSHKARRYGEALQQNTVVLELRICVGSGLSLDADGNLDLLFEFVEKSRSLTSFTLDSMSDVRVISRFLLALSRSSTIKEISLTLLKIDAESLKRFLCYTQSVNKLEMSMIHLTSLTGESPGHSTGQTPAQIPQNRSIEELKLTDVEESSIVQVLYQFGSQSKIRRFSLGGGRRNPGVNASMSEGLQQFLTASDTIESIEFDNLDFQASSFEPISAALKHSQNLQKMILKCCRFDSVCTELFKNIFQCEESKIESLKISGETKFETALSSVISEIISLKPKTSKLTEINLANLVRLPSSTLDLATLMRPLEEESTLEHLDIGLYRSPAKVQELLSSIPRIRGLKEITFDVRQDYYDRNKKFIVQAFKQNWSLEKVNCFRWLEGVEDVLTKIQLTCDRNKTIQKWIAASHSVPTSYWPVVFASYVDNIHRHDVIFRGLIYFNAT